MVQAQLAQERSSPGGGERPRKIVRHPALPSLDIATASPALHQVKVQERLAAEVEDPGPLLDDSGPGAQLDEQVGEIVEELGRTVRHGTAFRCPSTFEEPGPGDDQRVHD
jgi:hypothetical protein